MTSGWLCQTLYCVAEYFCFCVLFWRLPIRGSSQNMLYIKNQYIRQLTDEYFIVSYSVASPLALDGAMPHECCITSSVQAPPPHRAPIEPASAAPGQIFLHSHKWAPHSTPKHLATFLTIPGDVLSTPATGVPLPVSGIKAAAAIEPLGPMQRATLVCHHPCLLARWVPHVALVLWVNTILRTRHRRALGNCAIVGTRSTCRWAWAEPAELAHIAVSAGLCCRPPACECCSRGPNVARHCSAIFQFFQILLLFWIFHKSIQTSKICKKL
jgi:hypothetical protein